jgi:hypothetical protein
MNERPIVKNTTPKYGTLQVTNDNARTDKAGII